MKKEGNSVWSDFVRSRSGRGLCLLVFFVCIITSGAALVLPQAPDETANKKKIDTHKKGGKQKKKTQKSKLSPTPPPQMENRAGIEFVWITPGSFNMGSESDESEKPVHSVSIRKGFYLGKYEVTQRQWNALMNERPRSSLCLQCPIESVSWDRAQSFIRKLNEIDKRYLHRLPTEAEWEYAARAGTTTDTVSDLDAVAWYANNSGRMPLDANKLLGEDESTYNKRLAENGNQYHSVGLKKKNAFGLFDMQGNVWEWVQDFYHENYNADPPIDGSAWLTGGDERLRVLRGGSIGEPASGCRFSTRLAKPPAFNFDPYRWNGLRVVAVPRR